MSPQVFDTMRDLPTSPGDVPPLSLVFIGSPEDDFRDAGSSVPLLGKSRVLFGRAAEAQRLYFDDRDDAVRVGLPHPWVSGEHCELALAWEGSPELSIRDLESRNGTLVENNRIEGLAGLDVGEVFEVGRTFWMVRGLHEAEASASPETEAARDPLAHPIFARLRDTLKGVATSDVPVLIMGETGTGKERLARAIHAHSRRKGQFVSMRLGAFDESELPAALIGSRRSSVPGFVEQAEGGTLLLTDLDTLTPKAQARLRALLGRVLEGKGRRRRDVRLLSASSVDLRALVAERRFRPELYARLAGLEVALPPLRRCRDCLGALIRDYARERPGHGLSMTTAAFRHALAHRWPYNVRELQHALDAALVITSEDGRISHTVLEEALGVVSTSSADVVRA